MVEWLRRARVYVFVALVVAILAGVYVIQMRRPRPTQPAEATSTSEPSPAPTPTPVPFHTYVTGAVAHPDVHLLSPGSIVKDAVMAAGGATEDADLERINLALTLDDGMHIHVPREGEGDLSVEPISRQPGSLKVNINTASAAELEILPGIGPVMAQRIIDYREADGPFALVEEITNVSGIGPATLEKLRELVTTD
jgi:competence protein ComEA